MKKLILAFIILLPLAANATHHRGHTIENARVALQFTSIMRYNTCLIYDRWDQEYSRTLTQQDSGTGTSFEAHARLACERAQEAESELSVIIDMLSDPEMPARNLLQIRRMMNKPWKNVDGVRLFPESVLYRYGIVFHHMAILLRYGVDPVRISHVTTWGKAAWEYADFTLWHINDAIIEELYTPEAFADE